MRTSHFLFRRVVQMNRRPTSHTATRRGARRPRQGFTLIETLIAISLLAGVVLTMAMSTTLSSKKVQASGARSRAQALVDQQISRARSWPTYSTISALSGEGFNGTANGLTSSTAVSTDTTGGKNITTVTVTVSGATTAILASPIVRSISIAAP